MLPVLISVGNLTVSSFGVFLALAFLFAVFLVWRLSRAWDLDEERILDLTLLTFFGGLLFGRAHFILENFSIFGVSFLKWILITKYPGLSFFGGFLGGLLTLFFLSKRFKLDFWQIADIASVGFLGGLILGNIGCFLGGCDLGVPSTSFLAVSMAGSLEKRLPAQIVEAFLLSLVLIRIWRKATHFHKMGTIFSLSLIGIGLVKIATQSLKAYSLANFILPLILVILGIVSFYKVTRRKFFADLRKLGTFFSDLITKPQARKELFINIQKNWYNQKVAMEWKLRSFKKLAVNLLRKLNVKISHKDA